VVKRSLRFPVVVHTTIRVCLSAMRLFFSDQIGQFRECQEPLWAKFKAKYLSAMRLFLFGGGESDQDELAQPAHFTVLEITSGIKVTSQYWR